ncbi:MAG TPA: alanine--glyoxylate aminotransferase family protein [Gemmatimonadaceae bacterium]|nr:alanine--glyoxylate aminotransferase family protein [Gemmatimonadaceae bacterium]
MKANEQRPRSAPLLLMTPGPTRIPERVLHAGSRPMIHHRTPEFSAELATALELLAPVFGTQHTPLPIHTTGRGGLEATICNLFSRGEEIAVCCNGKFGEMWAGLAESYGVIAHRWSTNWERDADPGELAALLDDQRNVKAVALAYGDTSTGVANDVPAIARVARAHGALVMVDAVSSLGGMPFAFDEWDLDVAVTASQKCLMSGPGLAWVALSERAWRAEWTSRLPRNYWNFAEVKRSIGRPRPETPGTPPVQIVLQVAEALRMMHEEGLENIYARHEAMARRARAGAATLGLSLQCPNIARHSATLTAVAVPPRIAAKPLRDKIRARGILTAAGLGTFETTAIRIGHMGDIRVSDVDLTLEALGEALRETPDPPAGATQAESV